MAEEDGSSERSDPHGKARGTEAEAWRGPRSRGEAELDAVAYLQCCAQLDMAYQLQTLMNQRMLRTRRSKIP